MRSQSSIWVWPIVSSMTVPLSSHCKSYSKAVPGESERLRVSMFREVFTRRPTGEVQQERSQARAPRMRHDALAWACLIRAYPPVWDRRNATRCAARFRILFARRASLRLLLTRFEGAPSKGWLEVVTGVTFGSGTVASDGMTSSPLNQVRRVVSGVRPYIETLMAIPTLGWLRLYM